VLKRLLPVESALGSATSLDVFLPYGFLLENLSLVVLLVLKFFNWMLNKKNTGKRKKPVTTMINMLAILYIFSSILPTLSGRSS